MRPLSNLLSKQKHILLSVLLIAIFITIVLTIKAPVKQTFEYDIDEGFELIKSALFLNGFSLYKEISNDQPPLFTLILSHWFRLFGPSVYHARILILIFSGILLWAFYGIIKNQWGGFCAFVAVVFLLLSTAYLRLSASLMIGTAALSFAMLSIYFLMLYRKSPLKRFLVLSGIFLGLSSQIKFFTVFVMPLIGLEIIRGRKQNNRFASILLWLFSFLIVFASITIVFFHFNFHAITQQLLHPHLKKIDVLGCDFSLIWRMILADYDITLLALIGIILLAKQKKYEFFFPVSCLMLTLVILFVYRPVWYHYYLPVSIFLSWLAAISFSGFFHTHLRGRWFTGKNAYSVFLRWVTAAVMILIILRLPGKYCRMRKSVWEGSGHEEHRVVELLSKYRKDTHWIFTDRPIFAFYANILVPPELALITEKRKFIDDLSQHYLIDKLEKYKPELILLTELKYCGSQVISYIEKNYYKIYHSRFSSPVWFLDSDIWAVKRMWIAKRIEFTMGEWLAYPNWAILRDCFTNKGWRERFNALAHPTFEQEIKLYMRSDMAKSLRLSGGLP